jgi:Rod binding domain-containing protein
VSDAIRPLGLRPEELAARPTPPSGKGAAEIHQAAVAFEGMLVSTMFQSMRKTVQPSGLLGDSGQAKGTLQYLLDQAIVDSAMKGGRTWGLARRLEEAWLAKDPKAK